VPRATVSVQTSKEDLKSCPGGYVELRRLSFGEKMERQSMLSKMKLRPQEEPTNRAGRRNRKSAGMEGEVEMLQAEATLFSFSRCIISHNLEDAEGNLLNLKSQRDIEKLDPKIGEEIDTLIDNMNNFADDEEDEEGRELGN
jgi:hypothetical protein